MKHQVVDQRSLELSRKVAEKLRANPDLISLGLKNIDGYISSPNSSHSGRQSLMEWKAILEESSLEETIRTLTEESEEGQRLRQSNPFAGILSEEERMTIFRKYESQRT